MDTKYRLQLSTVLLGILIPWIATLAVFTDFKLSGQRDLAPLAFTFGNIIVTWGLFRYGLFDLVPIARDRVLENMPDSVVI